MAVRGLVSDGIHNYLEHGLAPYRREGLVNRVDDAEANGNRVGGNAHTARAYSEYWTFIRGNGVRGAIGVEPCCPNCGGELKIGMAGNCEFCNAHVTAGEFDWVLSKIEQDEAYAG